MSEGYFTLSEIKMSQESVAVEVTVHNQMAGRAKFRVSYLPSFRGGATGEPTLRFIDIDAGKSGSVQAAISTGDFDSLDFDVAVSSQDGPARKIHLPMRSA